MGPGSPLPGGGRKRRMHLKHFPHAPARACRMFRPIATYASLRPCSPASSPTSAGSSVEHRGVTRSCSRRADTADIALGASIACSGACLTVVDKGPGWFAVDVSAETLARTALGLWQPGTPLNLERALQVGDELGGHIVTGHVDGVGEIVDRRRTATACASRSAAPALARYLAAKGSVTVDGVSLTVNEVEVPRWRRSGSTSSRSPSADDDLRPPRQPAAPRQPRNRRPRPLSCAPHGADSA